MIFLFSKENSRERKGTCSSLGFFKKKKSYKKSQCVISDSNVRNLIVTKRNKKKSNVKAKMKVCDTRHFLFSFRRFMPDQEKL